MELRSGVGLAHRRLARRPAAPHALAWATSIGVVAEQITAELIVGGGREVGERNEHDGEAASHPTEEVSHTRRFFPAVPPGSPTRSGGRIGPLVTREPSLLTAGGLFLL
jgi:hypothetical protein